MFKSFKDLNQSIADLKELPIIQPLQQALSIVKSVLATVSYLPSEYARLYAQIQQLKYDPTTGDVSDVTPESQSTIPDSAIAQAKQSVDKLTQSLTSIKDLKIKQNVQVSGVQTISYFGVYLKHAANDVLDFGIQFPDLIQLVGSTEQGVKPRWPEFCIEGVKETSLLKKYIHVSPVLNSDGTFVMAGYIYNTKANSGNRTARGGYFFVNVNTYDIYVIHQQYHSDGTRSEVMKDMIPGNTFINAPINKPLQYFSSIQGLFAVASTLALGNSYFYGSPLFTSVSIVHTATPTVAFELGEQNPNGARDYMEFGNNHVDLVDDQLTKYRVDTKGFDIRIGDVLPDIQPIIDSLNNL